MRKRVEELAAGRIEDAGPVLEFSVPKVEVEVFEGTDFTGEFVITVTNHVPLRGMVYSSCSRMECLTPRFEGEEVKIRYEFHSKGLTEGDIQKGEFFIVCNQCEYNLSFVAFVSRHYADSGVGSIRGLSDFTRLAQEQWGEAKRMFYSPCFTDIMKRGELAERLLYQGIAKGLPTDRNLEEFLLAVKRKSPVIVKADSEELAFYNVKERIRESVRLEKNGWGFVELSAVSDAEFLVLQKTKITTEDFLGSEMEFGFLIDPAKMHGGKNFGCIRLKDIHQELRIHVCASGEEEGSRRDESRREIRALHAKVLRIYVEYRLKKLVTGKWAIKTCEYMDELIALCPGNYWYRLMKAQAFLINGQRQESEWLLNDFKRKWKDRKSPQWAYYMYICTLMEHEELYIDRLTEEIEQIYLENSDNPILFWCLLFVREDYVRDRYQKLGAIRHRIESGSESPLLYVEAYCLFCQEPYLMKRMGDFEWKVLNWARKQKMLTRPLAEQMLSAFPERLTYQRLVLLLLEACYEQWPAEEALQVICVYLIKNQKYGRRFFPWYERGVDAKLKITGLYEAYLMSMDSRSVQEVPKIILMYFKYNNQLGYRQKAILYVNIIANKEKQPEIYEQYGRAMEQFAYEQMEQKHMDDNLAVIYQEVTARGVYSSQLAEVLADVLFVHKLTCLEPEAARIIVWQKQLEKPKIVPLVNGTAYFPLYSNDYCIFVEDCYGNRYSGSVMCQLEKLMYPGRYLRACLKYAPKKLSYVLYYFSNREAQEIFSQQDLIYFQTVMDSDEVSRSYRALLAPKMFRLLQELEQKEDMARQLLRIDMSVVPPRERGELLEICVDNRLYDPVYRFAEEYGWERISLSGRVRLLGYEIERLEYAEDESLLGYCMDIFFAGKYNDVILRYLIRYYQGATKTMADIWKKAGEYELDALALEERILQQVLYTTEYVDCVPEIYRSYRGRGSRKLKKAYLTYFSHCWFVGCAVPPENLFDELILCYKQQEEINTVCGLALLRYCSEHPDVQRKEVALTKALLQKYVLMGMYFAFYKDFWQELTDPYQLYDKYFIECRGEKNSRVLLHYKTEDGEDYITEEMTEMYDGIFVKMFSLFYGDTIQYFVTEESRDGQEVIKSGMLTGSGAYGERRARYDLLNEMEQLKRAGDTAKFQRKARQYQRLDKKEQETFTILT